MMQDFIRTSTYQKAILDNPSDFTGCIIHKVWTRVLPDIRQPDIRAPDMAIFRISGISGSGNCFAGYPAGYPVSGSCRIFRILYCFFSFVSVTFNTYHRTVADMKAAREDISFSVVAIWVFSAVRVCVFVEVQWILLVLLDSTWK